MIRLTGGMAGGLVAAAAGGGAQHTGAVTSGRQRPTAVAAGLLSARGSCLQRELAAALSIAAKTAKAVLAERCKFEGLLGG